VNIFVLRPLPFPDADRIVSISALQKDGDIGVIDEPTAIIALSTKSPSFKALAAHDRFGANVTGGALPERVSGSRVSQEFFDVIGVRPEVGRAFLADEMQSGGPRVAVVSAGLAARLFGDAREVDDRTITLDGERYTIVGIMPADFDFAEEAQFWLPRYPRTMPGGGFFYTNLVGRLAPHATFEAAHEELMAMRRERANELPKAVVGTDLTVLSLHERLHGSVRRPLLLVWTIVWCVLLIACANVANLLFVRSAVRRRELALRTAIGASRARLVGQLLVESVLLAGLGGIAGLILAEGGLRLFNAFGPRSLVDVVEISVDYPVLLFTVGVAIAAGLLCGVWPALSASRTDLHEALKGFRVADARMSRGYPKQTLVIVELAIAMALTIGGALLAKSFIKFQAIDGGFDANRVLTASVSLPRNRYADESVRRDFYQGVQDRLRSIGAIESFSVTRVGLTGMTSIRPWPLDGSSGKDAEPLAILENVGLGHFRTFGIRLIAGTECVSGLEMPHAVVNERMARRAFVGGAAVGQRLNLGEEGTYTVVGIATDIRDFATKDRPLPTIYTCADRSHASLSALIAVRARPGIQPATLAPLLRRIVADTDPSLPVADLVTVSQSVRNALTTRWFEAALVSGLAALALVLAVVGLYAVIAFLVTLRMHEMGVRMALGATRADVMRLVLARGAVVTAAGMALGFSGAVVTVRFLAAMLFEVHRFDLSVFVMTGIFLAIVSMVAAFMPAWRASRVDPLIALQSE
jgi:putative ABC transport system permease protein